jgi:hypothetical protein
MTKYCFQRRITVVTECWFEADCERKAWSRALAGDAPESIGDERIPNEPIFRRQPKKDEFDL